MGNRIREFREKAGMTQDRLGELAGTTGQHISRLEKGERRLTTAWMEAIAPALGVAPSALMEQTGLAEVVEDEAELLLLHTWRKLPPEVRHRVLDFVSFELDRHTSAPPKAV